MKALKFTWSRWTNNPVEHIADDIPFGGQPICPAFLVGERQTFGEQATGNAPVCKSCLNKLFRFAKKRDGLYVNGFAEMEVVRRPKMIGGGRHIDQWVAQKRLSASGTAEISVHDSRVGARDAAVAEIKKYRDVKVLLATIERRETRR